MVAAPLPPLVSSLFALILFLWRFWVLYFRFWLLKPNANLKSKIQNLKSKLFFINFPNLRRQLTNLERFAFDFRERDCRDEIFRPEQHGQLSEIQFRHQHAVKTSQHIAQIFRERVEMAQVGA